MTVELPDIRSLSLVQLEAAAAPAVSTAGALVTAALSALVPPAESDVAFVDVAPALLSFEVDVHAEANASTRMGVMSAAARREIVTGKVLLLSNGRRRRICSQG